MQEPGRQCFSQQWQAGNMICKFNCLGIVKRADVAAIDICLMLPQLMRYEKRFF